jgi:phosphoribosylglycinamide formyltransferase-1
MAAIDDAITRGSLDARIALVLSNNPAAAGLEIARQRGLPHAVVDRRDGRARAERHREILARCSSCGVELLVCAGFDEILTNEVTDAYADRILNIHPSLLPAFGGGMHAVRDALAFGAKVSGCTVHFTNADLDNGPVIVQRAVPVLEDDTEETLAARILEQEHVALPEAIGLFASGRLLVEGRRVHVLPAVEPANR